MAAAANRIRPPDGLLKPLKNSTFAKLAQKLHESPQAPAGGRFTGFMGVCPPTYPRQLGMSVDKTGAAGPEAVDVFQHPQGLARLSQSWVKIARIAQSQCWRGFHVFHADLPADLSTVIADNTGKTGVLRTSGGEKLLASGEDRVCRYGAGEKTRKTRSLATHFSGLGKICTIVHKSALTGVSRVSCGFVRKLIPGLCG